jgi:hypothetical protein
MKRLAATLFGAALLYLVSAWLVFQWRNPKANQMSFFRDFKAVVMWQKLERYQ